MRCKRTARVTLLCSFAVRRAWRGREALNPDNPCMAAGEDQRSQVVRLEHLHLGVAWIRTEVGTLDANGDAIDHLLRLEVGDTGSLSPLVMDHDPGTCLFPRQTRLGASPSQTTSSVNSPSSSWMRPEPIIRIQAETTMARLSLCSRTGLSPLSWPLTLSTRHQQTGPTPRRRSRSGAGDARRPGRGSWPRGAASTPAGDNQSAEDLRADRLDLGTMRIDWEQGDRNPYRRRDQS
jgi:hypothetical protein